MTVLIRDWLPERHLHVGVATTLSHADDLIGQVSELLFDYQTQGDGVFGLCEVPVGGVQPDRGRTRTETNGSRHDRKPWA